MSKITLTGFALLSLLFFGNGPSNHAAQSKQNVSGAPTGIVQKMIVENASVTMQLDLNGLNGSNSLVARPVMLQFAAAPNSFFPILVFNNLLRAAEPGSMSLMPQYIPAHPVQLGASLKQLALEKLSSNQDFDLAVRDTNTGFTFFMSKEPSTTTMPTHSRLPSPKAGFSYQNSLPTRWATHQTQAQSLEKFLSAQRCNQSRLTVSTQTAM